MPGGLRIRPGVTDARTRSAIGKITEPGLNTSAASAVRPFLNMGGARYGNRIDPDEAYRLEEQARHDRRPDEAHYWARYREGLEGGHQHQPQ
jgi:hypothetical protein